MIQSNRKTIGILGGMGPSATVDFMSKVIAATPAARDQDHVPLIVRSVPQIPDRSAAILSGDDGPFAPMLAGLKALERAGADVLVIPCNTAHVWYDRLATRCHRPILHICDAVSEQVSAANDLPLGLMATAGTVATQLYPYRLGRLAKGLILPTVEDQQIIDAAISRVKAGLDAGPDVDGVAQRMMAAGARRIILACTELPIAVAVSPFRALYLDATEALAVACVERSGCGRGNLDEPAHEHRVA